MWGGYLNQGAATASAYSEPILKAAHHIWSLKINGRVH